MMAAVRMFSIEKSDFYDYYIIKICTEKGSQNKDLWKHKSLFWLPFFLRKKGVFMLKELLLLVAVAAMATVGLEEFLKNFLVFKNTKWYAVLMVFIAVGCYVCAYLLPPYVIGSILTIGCVQLCYQTLVQSFKAIVENLTRNIPDKTRQGFNDSAIERRR